MYAIVEISGKQYRVSEGDTIKVSSQDWKIGDRVKLDRILFTDNGENISIGTPTVRGASVTVEILKHDRDKKLLIYKKKRRKGYQRKNGHRQGYTLLKINNLQITATKKVKEKNSNKETANPVSKK